MAESIKIAIVVALEREVSPLVAKWRRVDQEFDDRHFICFEQGSAVLICGGIGQEAARRATEAIAVKYHPELLVSAGFAGALDPNLRVGEIITPSRVIDAKDSSRTEIPSGSGVLVSGSATAGAAQKAKLASSYGAQAVDMEAAAVARGAQKHGIAFAALKAISDERDFEMPSMDRFVSSSGQLRSGAFVLFALLRPWLWPSVFRLARNSAKASRALCFELSRLILDTGHGTTKQLQATGRV